MAEQGTGTRAPRSGNEVTRQSARLRAVPSGATHSGIQPWAVSSSAVRSPTAAERVCGGQSQPSRSAVRAMASKPRTLVRVTQS